MLVTRTNTAVLMVFQCVLQQSGPDGTVSTHDTFHYWFKNKINPQNIKQKQTKQNTKQQHKNKQPRNSISKRCLVEMIWILSFRFHMSQSRYVSVQMTLYHVATRTHARTLTDAYISSYFDYLSRRVSTCWWW